MATVRQALALQDRMSPVLSKIMTAMHSTINVMEQMNVAAERGINPAAFSRARAEISKAELSIESLRSDVSKLDQPIDNARKGFASWQAAIVTAQAGIQLVQQGIHAAGAVTGFFDSLSSTSSRLDLVTDELNTQASLQQKIFESAQRSRASYQETASAVAKLNLLAGNQFASNEEAIAFAETMNKAFVISGADPSEQSAAMRQMSQAMASGRLQGDEYNSIIENAPLVAQAIEKYMGVSRGELKKLASEGKITADIIKTAVFQASEEIDQQFAQMPMKFSDHMTQLKNNAIMALAPITERFQSLAKSEGFAEKMERFSTVIERAIGWLDELLAKMEEIGQSDGFQTMMHDIGTAIGVIGVMLGGLITSALWVVEIFTSNWTFISPILWGIVAALAAYVIYLGISNTIEAISNTIKGISAVMSYAKAAGTNSEAAATASATAAQYGFNAALLASPITWILIAIIAVIVAIYLAVAAINKITGSTISATGIILGALAVAGAFIWDLFLGILDLVLGVINYLVNPILAFVNFFGNVFKDPIGSVVHLFGQLADNVLGVIESIAKAMDKVFGSDMASAVQGWRSSLDAKINTAAEKYGNGAYEEVVGNLNLSSEDLGLKRIKYSDAWSKGYSAGENVDASVEGIMDKVFGGIDPDDLIPPDDPGDTLFPTQYTNGNDINVDASGSEVSLSDEDIKYLRDIAKLEYVNQYTTLRPTVQANFGDIHETADVNQVIAVFEDAVEAAYASSLERG